MNEEHKMQTFNKYYDDRQQCEYAVNLIEYQLAQAFIAQINESLTWADALIKIRNDFIGQMTVDQFADTCFENSAESQRNWKNYIWLELNNDKKNLYWIKK